jgi:hypothetical protein
MQVGFPGKSFALQSSKNIGSITQKVFLVIYFSPVKALPSQEWPRSYTGKDKPKA